MRRGIIIFMLLTLYLFGETIGLLGGSNSGTYIKIARDIKEVSKKEMNIDVRTGGSLGNINKLLKDRHSQFAIVQYDTLLYKRDIEGKSDLDKRIKMIFPLYNEEIHIIVRKDSHIDSIRDLENKRVNTDKKMSGCWVTSQMIKKIHNINWKEYNFGPKEALVKLVKNRLDAFIYVVGKPAPILEQLPASSKDVIKLISPDLDDYYVPTKFEKDTYPWLDDEIQTNATKALLITYNYNEKSKNRRFKYYIDNIRKLAGIINDNLEYLRENKHPKWKEIDPKEYDKVKWPLHKVAKEAIFNQRRRTTTTAEDKMLEALRNSR
jgi:TRAP transporter TAXI family solute receptor